MNRFSLIEYLGAHFCLTLAVYIAGPQHPYQPYPQEDASKVFIRYIEDYLELPLPDGIALKLQAYVERFATWPCSALRCLFDEPHDQMANEIYDLRIYYHDLLKKCPYSQSRIFNLPLDIADYGFLDAYYFVTPVYMRKQFPPQSIKKAILQQINDHPQPLIDKKHSCCPIETEIFD